MSANFAAMNIKVTVPPLGAFQMFMIAVANVRMWFVSTALALASEKMIGPEHFCSLKRVSEDSQQQ